MKLGGLVLIERGYEKAVSRSKLEIERNTSLLEVTMPIGVIRSLATVKRLSALRSARGSAPSLVTEEQPEMERAPMLRRSELALVIAIMLVLAAAVVVAMV